MKLLISGDWHLGKMINNYSMIQEQTHILSQIKQQLITNNVDVLVITGDVYDRAIPPKEAIEIFDTFLNSLINELKINVVIVSGNHDSYERLSFGNQIFKAQGLYIGEKFVDHVDKVTLTDEFGPINFHLIPFAPYQETKMMLQDNSVTSFHRAYEKMLASTKIDNTERNVLVTHAYVVSNVVKPEISDSEKTLALGGIEFVDSMLFKEFDYVALGHIHKAQRIGSEFYRYAGSILKYSFSEVNHKKSTILLELLDKGTINQSLLPLHARRDFVVIKDTFDNIINNTELINRNKDNYVKFILQDEIEIIDVFSKLRVYFNYIMELKYETARDIALSSSFMNEDLAKQISDVNNVKKEDIFLELFKDFALKTAKLELSDEQIKLVKNASTQMMKEDQSK